MSLVFRAKKDMHLTKTTEFIVTKKIVSGNHTSVSEHKPELSMKQTVIETGFFANRQKQCKCQGKLIAWAECFGGL